MNIDQLRKQLPNEAACRQFFESIIWADGRVCPHCKCEKSYHLQGQSVRQGLYECAQCKSHFTVTTHTPLHSTKLPLWKWLQAIFITSSAPARVSLRLCYPGGSVSPSRLHGGWGMLFEP